MSGTYENIEVPSTLISFATTTVNPQFVISPEFKEIGSTIVFIKPTYKNDLTIDHNLLIKKFNCITNNIQRKHIISAYTLKQFGIAEGISKMCFGNKLGCVVYGIKPDELFKQYYGGFILEVKATKLLNQIFKGISYQIIGQVTNSSEIVLKDFNIVFPINQLIDLSNKKLATIYNYENKATSANIPQIITPNHRRTFSKKVVEHPLVVIPVFPGTNCEFDTQNAFLRCKAKVQQVLIRNQTSQDLLSSIDELASAIKRANILMLPGGFSAADEPDGSAKFIVNVFHNEKIKKATHHLLAHDGLILGICNGFQALIKLGLLTHGKITKLSNDSPTLTYNKIHHHVSDIVRTKVVCNKSP
jgi:phosphoribosylformylglycinamidine synthase